MNLPSVDREITTAVVQRFVNLNLSTPRRELEVKFRPHGSDVVQRLVKCNVLRQLDDENELIPNAMAFHYCGNKDALDFAKTSVEILIPVLQHLFETTPEGVLQTTGAVEATVKSLWPDVKPEAIRLGLFLAREMALLSGPAWNGNQTGVQTVRVNKKTINIEASKAWNDYIRQYSKYVVQVYREEAREKFLQGMRGLGGLR